MKKAIIWIVCILLLAAIISWGIAGAKSRAIIVKTIKIEKHEVKRILRTSGKLQSTSDGRILAPISGKIAELPIKDGQAVSKDQVIARFDTSSLEIAVDSAKSSLKTTKVNKDTILKSAPTDLKLTAARQTVDQMRILLDQARANKEDDDTTITRDAYEAAKTNHQNALAALETLERLAPTSDQIDAASQAIEVAQKSLAEAEKNLAVATLTASQSGILDYFSSSLTSKIGVGTNVTAGTQVFNIISPNNLYFAAEMEGEDLEMITIGTKAEISIDAYPDDHFIGTINLIENQTTTTSTGAQVYLVHLNLDKTKTNFRAGLAGNANFTLETKKDVLTAPIEAISEEDGAQIVYIFDNGLAKKAIITTGLEDDTNVEVRSGLSLGQEVIVGDNLKDVKDGSKVKKK